MQPATLFTHLNFFTMQTRKRTTETRGKFASTLLSYPEIKFSDPLTNHVLNTFGQQPKHLGIPDVLDELLIQALLVSDWTVEQRCEKFKLIARLKWFVTGLDESRLL